MKKIHLEFYGSYFQQSHSIWKYCFIYVTNHRIFGWNNAFNKILFEVPLARIQKIEIGKGIYQGEKRDELRLILKKEEELYLHSRDLTRLQDSFIQIYI